jgi:hypothetical protein
LLHFATIADKFSNYNLKGIFMNQLLEFCQQLIQKYPSPLALTGGALCALATIEMALRTLRDIPNLSQADAELKRNFSRNLGGAAFYGLSALNLVPHSAIVGGVIFALYSAVVCDDSESYYASRLVGTPIRWFWDHVVFPLSKWAVEDVIVPLTQTIVNCVGRIFSLISLPQEPAWYGVAALVIAIAAYKFVPTTLDSIS